VKELLIGLDKLRLTKKKEERGKKQEARSKRKEYRK